MYPAGWAARSLSSSLLCAIGVKTRSGKAAGCGCPLRPRTRKRPRHQQKIPCDEHSLSVDRPALGRELWRATVTDQTHTCVRGGRGRRAGSHPPAREAPSDSRRRLRRAARPARPSLPIRLTAPVPGSRPAEIAGEFPVQSRA